MLYKMYIFYVFLETSRDTGAQSVTIKSTGCEFDPHSQFIFNFFALVSRQSAALSFGAKHTMPSEFGETEKLKTKCLNFLKK